MIDGIVSKPTFVDVDGVIHDVWRVALSMRLCNTQCDLDVWFKREKEGLLTGVLCDGPTTCIDCIARREVL